MSESNGHQRSPDEIRHEIEDTREHLAQTAAALAEKADVKARAHEKVDETKARITGRAAQAKEKVSGATPHSVAGAAQAAQGTARSNPVPAAAIAAFAAGLAIGLLIAHRHR
jgi:ElaB/YqjD/DUF883 family membrane-anchored ribosome-binding protein